MSQKAIIFGASGQDAFYLNEVLQKNHFETILVSRSKGHWVQADVSDYTSVSQLIKQHQPKYVFHLAATSSTAHKYVFENHKSISTGSLNILEACYQHAPQTKVFLSGSAVQFENSGKPINEQTPFKANSPYAISRIQSTYAARYYRSLGLRVYIGFFFHHDSPLRKSSHINQQIVQTALQAAEKQKAQLTLRNIKAEKEFNFAGDFMHAVYMMVQQEKHFELVIGSGKKYNLEYWCKLCFELLDLDYSNYIDYDLEKSDCSEVIYSDPTKLFSIGYQPKYSIEALAKEMLFYTFEKK